MEIRREIESLALWYIPVFIAVTIITTFLTGYANSLVETGQATPAKYFAQISILSTFLNFIDNFVVGIWLYIRGKGEGGRAVLWLIFGIAAHFFAALMYIGIKIYEQQISNHKPTTSFHAGE
jgi:hypothetical protein